MGTGSGKWGFCVQYEHFNVDFFSNFQDLILIKIKIKF
jgi:hypothetical protein